MAVSSGAWSDARADRADGISQPRRGFGEAAPDRARCRERETTGCEPFGKGPYALTPDTVELIPTLGALFPRGGSVQDPVLTWGGGQAGGRALESALQIPGHVSGPLSAVLLSRHKWPGISGRLSARDLAGGGLRVLLWFRCHRPPRSRLNPKP